MDISSYNWTDSFKEYFAGYFSDGNNSRTITIPYYNSYLLSHHLKTLVFERVLNCNNYLLSGNLQSPNLESRSNGKSQIPFLENDMLARLSDFDLLKFQKFVSRELRSYMFVRLFNSNLLELVTRQLQDVSNPPRSC